MPTWTEILEEISGLNNDGEPAALDTVRRKYVRNLANLTERNVITYYSGFLQKSNLVNATSINDADKNGFMTCVNGMDRSKGLDLILHTPGGTITAAESIVHYLRTMFDGNIRAIVPQMAMSAGTMIACACSSILMGKQSNLGPFDPQFNGVSAFGVLQEFEEALEKIKEDPASIPLWATIIQKYHPGFLGQCERSIQMATSMVTTWLNEGMLKDDEEREIKISKIMEKFNNPDETLEHSRHIHGEEALDAGLVIEQMEENQDLQDAILSVHHSYMITFGAANVAKIVENNLGTSYLNMIGPMDT